MHFYCSYLQICPLLRWNYFVLRIVISRIPCGMSLRMPSELLHYVVKYNNYLMA